MANLDEQDAKRLLEKSEFVRMGPFMLIKTGKVIKRGHKKYGALAHCFRGKYHRHFFYIFKNNEIIFVNEEDDDELW